MNGFTRSEMHHFLEPTRDVPTFNDWFPTQLLPLPDSFVKKSH
jgi:hypothetical protein